MNETPLQNKIRLSVSSAMGNVRLFRNQVGTYQLADGRWLKSGLPKGSSDLVGWRTIEVTQEMVGQKIAQFVGLEIKTKRKGSKESKDQERWRENLTAAGGLSLVVRAEQEAIEKLR